eukprot:15191098-Alexandrium_andersonii.AAC.1
MPAQNCSSVPSAWLAATLHGKAVVLGPGPAESSAHRGCVSPKVLLHLLIGLMIQLTSRHVSPGPI